MRGRMSAFTAHARMAYPTGFQALVTVVVVTLYMVLGSLIYRHGFAETKECESAAALAAHNVSSGEPCTELWSVIDTLYFIMVSMSTVGYGDLTPTTIACRVFTVFWVLIGCTFIFYHLSHSLDGVLNAVRGALVLAISWPVPSPSPKPWLTTPR